MLHRVPAGRRWLAREAVARHRRNHEVEGIRCTPAMRRGIGQRLDDLQLLDDRAGPSMRDDHRQRILVLGTHVDEMNVEPVDLGDEMRQGLSCASTLRQSCSSPNSAPASASVASCTPVADVDPSYLFALRPLVALMRRRSSSSSSCGKLTVKGRIASAEPCSMSAVHRRRPESRVRSLAIPRLPTQRATRRRGGVEYRGACDSPRHWRRS